MVEIQNPQAQAQHNLNNAENRNFFKMKTSERMGGSMPVWGRAENAKEDVMHRLVTSAAPEHSFEHALSLQSSDQDPYVHTGAESFGFGDVVDMINPLHHIPVVGHVYREITGDEIRSIGKIVGGALFGGPAGAASGLVNAVIEEETGEDLTQNAMNLVLQGKAPHLKSQPENPSQRLDNALNDIAQSKDTEDLPASLLAFTDQSNGRVTSGAKSNHKGFFGLKSGRINTAAPVDIGTLNLPAREEITVITLSNLPKNLNNN